MRTSIVFLFLILSLAGCKNDIEEKCAFIPDTKNITIDLQVEFLEDSLPAITSKTQLVNFLSRHIIMRDFLFNRKAYPNDSVFINTLYSKFTNPHIDTLLFETKKVFGNGTELQQELTTAFTNLTYYYPDFQVPKVETVITGLETDLFVSDSLIIIGLDYYLGKGARYRPDMHEYMLRRYDKNFIVPSIMLLYGIDSRYNDTDLSDRTMLADMVTYGKAYYFAKHMMPCTPDSVLIGYTAEEIAGARANQGMIWKRLIEDEAFFSTDGKVKQRYIGERPKTFEVGDQAPGRIGTWVGWQIVNTYAARKSDLPFTQVMMQKDAKLIFNESRYRPTEK
ncbi:MAG: gliding motility lipoprotein GldB [Cyclobacteriaceae bacterium]|nr:gliding motility lipoprotein GldB [Cyclobacteriaceae bacterium]